jgi:5-methylcytosine-specific restriction endonuclease McrA
MDALVLVLNANFEPINVCNSRRAIGMMLDGRAALIANGRGVIQTVSRTFPLPSVIRLEHMVQRPRPHIKLSRREVFRRDNYTCQYCGRKMLNLTIDHVMPRHLGGMHVWTNVVTACSACNHQKGGRRLEESRMSLMVIPREPPANASYIFGRHLPENEEWVPFIEGW